MLRQKNGGSLRLVEWAIFMAKRDSTGHNRMFKEKTVTQPLRCEPPLPTEVTPYYILARNLMDLHALNRRIPGLFSCHTQAMTPDWLHQCPIGTSSLNTILHLLKMTSLVPHIFARPQLAYGSKSPRVLPIARGALYGELNQHSSTFCK